MFLHFWQVYSVQRQDDASEDERKSHLQAQIGAIQMRLTRLIDAFVDGTLNKEDFESRKRTLLEEERSLTDSLRSKARTPEVAKALVEELFELASSAQQSYRLGNSASRREMAIRLCSNRSVSRKDVSVKPSISFARFANRELVADCDLTGS